MSEDENKKEAVNIGVTLSTQLIAASLTMIAVLGAFSTFIIDKRDVDWSYYIYIGISFITFILSVFFGGKGINKARENGFKGDWNLEDTKSFFNQQAGLCIAGLLFFIVSIFGGKEKPDSQLNSLTKIERNVYAMQLVDSLQHNEMNKLKEEIKQLKKLILPIKPDTIKASR